MEIVLKNVKYVASMSEETHCFSATIYIDGVKAGEVSNRGYGGPNEYSNDDVVSKIDAYGKTLPPHVCSFKGEDGKPVEMEIDAEIIIGDLMNKYLTEKNLKRLLSNRIVFTKVGEKGTYETATIPKARLAIHLQNPEKIREQLKSVDQILNLLPFDEAVAVFSKHNDIE